MQRTIFFNLLQRWDSWGSTLLLILFLVLFFKAASGIRSFSLKDPRRYIGIGGLVGILALMFHSQVEKNMQVPANAFLYTFLWGIVLRLSTRKVEKGADRKKPMNRKEKSEQTDPSDQTSRKDSRLWFVVHTKPGNEERVKSNLTNQEIESFLPLMKGYQYSGGKMVAAN